MPKNQFFRHISGIFGRKNFFFKNLAPSHFGQYHFVSVCKISWKNISSTAWDIQEILFFQRKLAVPAIFRQFRLQKSVFLTIETCLMVGIAINNVFVWKNNKIWRKTPNKIWKNGDFWHISGIFGWKKFFLKNRTRPCFGHC